MIGLIAFIGFVATWWWIAKIGKRNNMRTILRHALGFFVGFLVLGFFAAIDKPSQEETEDVSVASEMTSIDVETSFELLDGEVPEYIQTRLAHKKAQMDISNGVLTIKLPSPDEVKEDDYRGIISWVIMSRWLNEENSDAPEGSNEENEEPSMWVDTPNWSGITTVVVSNSSESQGFKYNSGADGFVSDYLKMNRDEGVAHIMNRTVAFGALTEVDKDAICRQDIKCLARQHQGTANVYCKDAVERLAQYSVRWTDSLLESKFDHHIWIDKENGIIGYAGDHVEYQNGFGAWQPHIYLCKFDTKKNQVADVTAEPGRL